MRELVTVKVNHPLGSVDEENPSIVYPINCGYVEKAGGDNLSVEPDCQMAYLLGVDVAVDEYQGMTIAVARRRDDSESVLIVAPENIFYDKQQIEEIIYFKEQYYDGFVEMVDEEIWDAYDAKENLLGYDLKRSMAKSLPEGVYHVVVEVYTLTKNGKILVTQRARNKRYPLQWEVSCGSVLKGETALTGAMRELFEETGIDAEPDSMILLYHHVDNTRHCIYYAYLHMIEMERHIVLQEGETMDYKYVPYEDFYAFVDSDRFIASERERFHIHKDKIVQTINSYVTNQI